MKIFLFLVCVFLCNTGVYSQNFEKIKNSDTIYLYFKISKSQMHLNTKITKNKQTKERDEYFYVFENSFSRTFIHDYFVSPEKKKEKKSFLKKNENLILTYDFFKKYNSSELTDLIASKKKIYLIDYDEIGWFTIKLKEVKSMNYKFNLDD